MTEVTKPAKRRQRRSKRPRERPPAAKPAIWPGLEGGAYQPLSQRDMVRIHKTAMDLLENVGMADPIPSMIEICTAAGCWMDENDRLCFPRQLVEDVIARAPKRFTMPGIDPKHDIDVGGKRVHTGTGGAAPLIMDFHSGSFRGSTTADLYDVARLVDTLDNIHYFWRTNVAGDAPTAFDLDINTAYASMMGTTKHIGVSYVDGKSVYSAVEMFDMFLGEEGEFSNRPFCSISCTHVVPPLRFAGESCDALEAAARTNMCITLISAAQAGATGPAALAGTIVLAIAETLAGLVFVNLINPQARANLGTWPFVSDLRTGAMCAGSAELGLIAAGCAQMAAFYDIPGSCAAGMTDSKIPDAQAGAEKGYTLALAANAGATLINESAGMFGSLMGSCLEGFVIDNDILGAVQRTVRGIEVNDDTLSYELIKATVLGEGHFLGSAQTIERMEIDYYYPDFGDRLSPSVWEEYGRKDIRERAQIYVKETWRNITPIIMIWRGTSKSESDSTLFCHANG